MRKLILYVFWLPISAQGAVLLQSLTTATVLTSGTSVPVSTAVPVAPANPPVVVAQPPPVPPPAPPVAPPAPAPASQNCCLCMVDKVGDESNAICAKHFQDNGCTNADYRATLVLGNPAQLGTDFVTQLGPQRIRACRSTAIMHADHSWSGSLEGITQAATTIQAASGTSTTVKSIGCGLFADAKATLARLKAMCAAMPANAPSITITGNQTIVTLADGDQRPATFVLPRDCEAINRVPNDAPGGIMSIASGLPNCAATVGKGCYTPTSNAGQQPNTGNGGSISCADDNGRVRQLNCIFTQDGIHPPVRNRDGVIIAVSTTGVWSLDPPFVVNCWGVVGTACYVEVGNLGNVCQATNDANVTGSLKCVNGRYCATVGGKQYCDWIFGIRNE